MLQLPSQNTQTRFSKSANATTVTPRTRLSPTFDRTKTTVFTATATLTLLESSPIRFGMLRHCKAATPTGVALSVSWIFKAPERRNWLGRWARHGRTDRRHKSRLGLRQSHPVELPAVGTEGPEVEAVGGDFQHDERVPVGDVMGRSGCEVVTVATRFLAVRGNEETGIMASRW